MKSNAKIYYLLGIGVFLFLGALARLRGEGAYFTFLLAYILTLLVFQRAWAAIQDGSATMTPGKAVGYSFIPVFNFYWLFLVMSGFAQDHNALLARRKIDAPELPVGYFTAAATLWLLSWLQFLGGIWRLAPLVLLVVQLMVVAKTFDAIEKLPKIEPDALAPLAAETPGAAPAASADVAGAADAAVAPPPDAPGDKTA